MPRVLALACLLGLASPTSAQSSLPAAFEAFLDAVDKAQLQLQNGDVAAFKSVWSQRDDVTLAGGFGGPIARGWPQISARLDAVGRQFTQGRHRATRISAQAGSDLGYVIQMEHVEYRVPGESHDSSRDYRVTMIFRREPTGWRLVHRQADTMVTNQMKQ